MSFEFEFLGSVLTRFRLREIQMVDGGEENPVRIPGEEGECKAREGLWGERDCPTDHQMKKNRDLW